MIKQKKSYNLQNTTRNKLLKNTKQYLQTTTYKELFTKHCFQTYDKQIVDNTRRRKKRPKKYKIKSEGDQLDVGYDKVNFLLGL